MKVTSVVSVLLLAACAQVGNPLHLREDSRDVIRDDAVLLQDNKDYEPLGCFSLRALKKEKILGNVFKKLEANSADTSLENCGQRAFNLQLFGIYYRQKKGKISILCQEGDEKLWRSDAKRSKRCKNRIGTGRNSIFIYRVNRGESNNQNNRCTSGNKSYSEGEHLSTYHPTDNILNAFCEDCTCLSNGTFSNCMKMYCELGFVIDHCKEFHRPPRACCPECKEYSPPKSLSRTPPWDFAEFPWKFHN